MDENKENGVQKEDSSDSSVQSAATMRVPEAFRRKIQELGGDPDDLFFVVEKQVTYDDLLPFWIPYFSMPVGHEKVQYLLTAMETLQLEEMNSIPVTLIEPCLIVTHVWLTKGGAMMPSGVIGYVLFNPLGGRVAVDNWENKLELDDVVQFWASRFPNPGGPPTLGLAMIKPSLSL